MTNEKKNREKFKELYARSDVHTMKENKRELWFRLGDLSSGYIIGYDKKLKLIVYYLYYVSEELPFIKGRTITQVQVWVDKYSNLTDGVARYIVFNLLLKKFSAIMADNFHTDSGKRFWMHLISDLDRSKYKVTLYNKITDKFWFPKKNEKLIDFWNRLEPIAYGKDSSKMYMRWIITKKYLDHVS